MRNPQKEVERLLKDPVITKEGYIIVNQRFPTATFIQVTLDPFPDDPEGHRTLIMCPPEVWVQLAAVMDPYFKPRKKKSRKKRRKR